MIYIALFLVLLAIGLSRPYPIKRTIFKLSRLPTGFKCSVATPEHVPYHNRYDILNSFTLKWAGRNVNISRFKKEGYYISKTVTAAFWLDLREGEKLYEEAVEHIKTFDEPLIEEVRIE